MNFENFGALSALFRPLDAAVPYLATSAGLINRSFVNIPYTVPAIFKAFLSTMDFRAAILYVVLLVVNVLILFHGLKIWSWTVGEWGAVRIN